MNLDQFINLNFGVSGRVGALPKHFKMLLAFEFAGSYLEPCM